MGEPVLVCLAVGGNHAGSGDDVIGLTLGGIVEERLGDGAERNAFLGDQNEGTLDAESACKRPGPHKDPEAHRQQTEKPSDHANVRSLDAHI